MGSHTPEQPSRADRFRQALATKLPGADRKDQIVSESTDRYLLDAVDRFRFALALRGASDPAILLDRNLNTEQRRQILDTLFTECEINRVHTGAQWMLKAPIRASVLGSHNSEEIIQALKQIEYPDAITLALRWLYVDPSPSISKLGSLESRALDTAVTWTNNRVPNKVDVRALRRHISRRAREDDYRRQLGHGFFGRDQEKQSLLRFLRQPSDAGPDQPIRAKSLVGTGGIGKSTLIAAVALELLRSDTTGFVHLDFDRTDLNPRLSETLELELLRQLGSLDDGFDERAHLLRQRIRAQIGDDLSEAGVKGLNRQSFASEIVRSSSSSVLAGALTGLRHTGKPLVLILDTFEQVQAAGDDAVWELRGWLQNLAYESGVKELRIVVSGRSGADMSWLEQYAPELITLLELDSASAVELLQASGVPASIAHRVAELFGGNPLVLRLAAEVVSSYGPAEINTLAEEIGQGKLPPTFIQGVLYDRILKHIKDDDARQYAHPGLVLPEITRELIQQVLGPINGEPEMQADRSSTIFEGLAEAVWLIERSADRERLYQRRDVRRLMLRMMTSDPKYLPMVSEIRRRAIQFHRARNTPYDRAFALYHDLMGVRDRIQLERFGLEEIRSAGEYLRAHIEDFPVYVQQFIRALFSAELSPVLAMQSLPDAAWAEFLLGAQRMGEKVSQTTDPMLALDLWRTRPIHGCKETPLFVLQSLVATAEWTDAEAAVPQLLSQLLAVGSSVESADRLVAITQLALLQDTGRLDNSHEDLLRNSLRDPKARHRWPELAALACVAEGLGTASPGLVPDERLEDGSVASEVRVYLVYARLLQRNCDWRPHLDALVVLRKDWAQIAQRANSEFATTVPIFDIQKRLLESENASFDVLQAFYRDLRRTVRVELRSEQTKNEETIQLLRGVTPEFYRPIRQALREALPRPEQISQLMHHFRPNLSICPAGFEPYEFARKATAEPLSYFLILTQLADYARALGPLIEAAQRVVGSHEKLDRVARAWKRWDDAICGYNDISPPVRAVGSSL